MKLSQLEQYTEVEKLIFHSLDPALYTVSALISGEDDAKEQMITDESGARLQGHNVINLQKQLRKVKASKHVIRQISAYDEMIGGPIKSNNEMEVLIGDNKLY